MFFVCSAGSNIDPGRNLPEGLHRVLETVGSMALSWVVRTTPVNMNSERPFLNTAFLFFSVHAPDVIKAEFKRIEALLGRDMTHPDRAHQDRPLDLDIVYAGPYRSPSALPFDEPYVRSCFADESGPPTATRTVSVGGVRAGDTPVGLRLHDGSVRRADTLAPLLAHWFTSPSIPRRAEQVRTG